jgi:hypothetical protein
VPHPSARSRNGLYNRCGVAVPWPKDVCYVLYAVERWNRHLWWCQAKSVVFAEEGRLTHGVGSASVAALFVPARA